MKNSLRIPHACLTLACAFWGANFIAAKILISHLDPFLINTIRWFFAALLIFCLYSKQMKQDWNIVKSNPGTYILLALLGQVGNQLLLTIGLQYSNVVNALIWMSAAPAFINVFNYIFFQQRINKTQLFGLVISIFGVLFLLTRGDFSKLQLHQGDECFIFASISWALYCCFSKQRNKQLSDQSFVGFSAMIASIFLISIATIAYFTSESMTINFDSIALLSLSYQIIFPSWIAYLLWAKGLDKIGSNVGGMYTNLITIFGVILSIIVLKEQIEAYHVISGFLVVMSIVMCSMKPKIKTCLLESK